MLREKKEVIALVHTKGHTTAAKSEKIRKNVPREFYYIFVLLSRNCTSNVLLKIK